MIKNEKRVIQELKKSNEEAFNIIYNEYYSLIYYIIYSIVDDRDVASDLVTDTFITMYNKIYQHDTKKSFKYWLITIAKNYARQYLRDKKDDHIILDNELVENCTNNEVVNYEESDLLSSCSKILNEDEFYVLNNHVVFKLTFTEIAQIMGISKSSAHRIYKRAIEKVKAELEV